MKLKSLRYNKPSQVAVGTIKTDTKGYRDENVVVAFTNLLELIPDYADKERPDGTIHVDSHVHAKFINHIGDKFYVFEEGVANAIGLAVKAINDAVQAAYDAGKEDGKKALILLNTGEITLEDFNKK